MIELLTIFGISVVASFVIGILRVAAEEGSIKIKEMLPEKNIFSWLFLYPLFESFSHWIESSRQALLRLGNAVLTFFRVILVLIILCGVCYLIYILIKTLLGSS